MESRGNFVLGVASQADLYSMISLRLRSRCDSRRKKDLPRRRGFRKRLLEAQGQLTSGESLEWGVAGSYDMDNGNKANKTSMAALLGL